MFAGGTIWLLTHGQVVPMFFSLGSGIPFPARALGGGGVPRAPRRSAEDEPLDPPNPKTGDGSSGAEHVALRDPAPPILVYFSWDWDVRWGYGLLTHGHVNSKLQTLYSRGWDLNLMNKGFKYSQNSLL